jgi:hypothetical protein
MPQIIYAAMRQRRNTNAYFTENNIVLDDGQIGVVSHGPYRNCFKFGDGISPWSGLPWATDYAILFNKPSLNQVTLEGALGLVDVGAAPLDSPHFTGVPTAPDPDYATPDQVATVGAVIQLRDLFAAAALNGARALRETESGALFPTLRITRDGGLRGRRPE